MRARWLLGLAVALALTVPAWVQWTDPHLNLLWEDAKGVDDAKNHMLRLYLLEWLLRRGVWYPRWVPDLFMGYGYPIFDFYAPGFYYLALLTRFLFRLDVWDAYRSGGPIAAVLGAAGSYTLTTALWRRVTGGIVAAVAVLYGPYVFQTNLFQRGDLPEALGLALLPWLLWALWRLWTAAPGNWMRWTLISAAIGAASLLAHNLTAIGTGLVAAVWVGYLAVSRRRSRALAGAALAGALAVGWSAFFWLPAIWETRDVQLDILREGHLDYRQWLLDPAGNTAKQQVPENRQTRGGLLDLHLHYPHQHQFIVTLKPSLGQALLGVLALAGAATPLWRRRAELPSPLPFLAVAVCCCLLLFTFSEPVWRFVPGLAVLQYPGRLMGLLGSCIAIAGAGGLALVMEWLAERWPAFGGRAGAWGLAGLVGGSVLFNSLGDREVPLAEHPRQPMDGRMLVKEEGDRFSNIGTTSGGEFTPRDVRIAVYTAGQRRGRAVFEKLYPERDWAGGLLYPVAGDLRLLGWHGEPLRVSAHVANDVAAGGPAALLGIRQFRFPGWRAWVDGKATRVGVAPYVEAQQASLGFMVVEVPPGEHTITLAFGPSAAHLIGIAATIGTGEGVALIAAWLALSAGRRQLAFVTLAFGVLPLALGWREVRPAFHRFAALEVPFHGNRDGVWRLPSDRGYGSYLLANLAEAARTGQAAISSPAGAAVGRDAFVDVRQLEVADPDRDRGIAGRSRRQWLYAHPRSDVAVDVLIPPGREVWFQAALTLDPDVWTAPQGDGVRFQVLVASSGGSEVVVVDRTLNPRANEADRRWTPVEADLSSWAGQKVRLTLRTLPNEDPAFDWAGWGNPMVVVRDFARIRLPNT